MNLTVRFTGHVANVIEELVARGIASTKTEALRLGVLKLEEEYLNDNEIERRFDESAVREVQRQEGLIKKGKMKVYSQKEFEKRIKAK
ncbi:hypothetical protein COV61_01625 [Candidatus Micrarchaeota archaeon CG11_big_fil_rev_8_21_14_0_20_47_5]|nr:MAG: hypothetical protein AUJ17_05780 [Candidatus Micrarchaeota archaeon CG1_02_47_40]PIN83940.1 MAG: hypothetical protein COV61_01625 [Candidatus Micrarchaeota archaeon CG11_big_fil_rev_8_21_14_0_20_47_5]